MLTRINSFGIKDNAIETAKVNESAITPAKLAFTNVGSENDLVALDVTGNFKYVTFAGGVEFLDDLQDVDVSGATTGQILSFNGTNWVAVSNTSGAIFLNDLQDVNLGTVTANQILKFNGTEWINATLTSGDIPLHNQPWNTITSTPNTVSGYGITDAVSTSREINTINSITGGGNLSSDRTLQLVNDVSSPGIKYYYGTGNTGVKGWNLLNLNAHSDVNITFPSNNQTLIYDAGTSKWINASVSGEANTGTNLGTGEGVFSSKLGVALQFKSLKAGPNVSITSTGTEITVSAAASGEANTASNIGLGNGIFASKIGVDLRFKSIVAGDNVTITSDASTLTINSTGGGTGATAINDLTDVQITSAVPGQVLTYSGTQWENANPVSGLFKQALIRFETNTSPQGIQSYTSGLPAGWSIGAITPGSTTTLNFTFTLPTLISSVFFQGTDLNNDRYVMRPLVTTINPYTYSISTKTSWSIALSLTNVGVSGTGAGHFYMMINYVEL